MTQLRDLIDAFRGDLEDAVENLHSKGVTLEDIHEWVQIRFNELEHPEPLTKEDELAKQVKELLEIIEKITKEQRPMGPIPGGFTPSPFPTYEPPFSPWHPIQPSRWGNNCGCLPQNGGSGVCNCVRYDMQPRCSY